MPKSRLIQDFKVKLALLPIAFFKIGLSGETIVPGTFTGDAAVISPGFPIGAHIHKTSILLFQ